MHRLSKDEIALLLLIYEVLRGLSNEALEEVRLRCIIEQQLRKKPPTDEGS